ncbi:hypothetical protein QTG54_008321 [Skeletonema marinoi]|uniref:Uncharacterized protein n=1 Tax=Skeletonema marinoi TaxID=267567 RepID=A0AAD8Y7A3_9STRA|nr:hypothetical protein QTG54_008321 [Skeletonema marinoi]
MKTAASSSPPSPSAPPSKRQKTEEEEKSEESEAVKNGLKVFFDQNQLALQKSLEEREAALKLAERQLKEAKRAVSVLFAEPGDLFTFHTCYSDGEQFTIKYVGRNTTPPRKVEFCGTYEDNRFSPEIGWLIFHNAGGYTPIYVCNGGIRDTIGAWPIAQYSHYDEKEMKRDTLCIPPEMCGDLKVWKGYGYDSDY